MARAVKKAATKNIVTMPRPVATSEAILSSADIAKRAFELYCERGCQDGYDLQDWLQAERELSGDRNSTAA
jgi:hypothetical protein